MLFSFIIGGFWPLSLLFHFECLFILLRSTNTLKLVTFISKKKKKKGEREKRRKKKQNKTKQSYIDRNHKNIEDTSYYSFLVVKKGIIYLFITYILLLFKIYTVAWKFYIFISSNFI